MPNTENLHEYIIPQMMRAIVLPEPNEAIDLADAELPVPICADNELLVKVEYVGLNPVVQRLGVTMTELPDTTPIDILSFTLDLRNDPTIIESRQPSRVTPLDKWKHSVLVAWNRGDLSIQKRSVSKVILYLCVA